MGEDFRARDPALAKAEPVSRLGPSGFDPARSPLSARLDARPSTCDELLLGALSNCDVELGRVRSFIGSILMQRETYHNALKAIAEGDEPRPVGFPWHEDARPSKNDKCLHGVWMYEDCGNCVAEFASSILAASGMEARQGGDVKQAPSRSDDSPPGRPNSTSQDR